MGVSIGKLYYGVCDACHWEQVVDHRFWDRRASPKCPGCGWPLRRSRHSLRSVLDACGTAGLAHQRRTHRSGMRVKRAPAPELFRCLLCGGAKRGRRFPDCRACGRVLLEADRALASKLLTAWRRGNNGRDMRPSNPMRILVAAAKRAIAKARG